MLHWLRVVDGDKVEVWVGDVPGRIEAPSAVLPMSAILDIYQVYLEEQIIGSVHQVRVHPELVGDPIPEEEWRRPYKLGRR